MRFERLLSCVGDESIFATQQLLDAGFDPAQTHRQLARWSRAGKLCRLRRGVYAILRPYCPTEPHPFEIANALDPDSYVSLDTALRWHIDPHEAPTLVRSVTPHRKKTVVNALGVFEFHHLYPALLQVPGTVSPPPRVACREKAYLDMVQQQRADMDGAARLAREFSWSGIDAEHMFDIAVWTGVSRLKRAAWVYRGICDHRKRMWGGVSPPTAPPRFAHRPAAMVESECSGKVRDDAFSAS